MTEPAKKSSKIDFVIGSVAGIVIAFLVVAIVLPIFFKFRCTTSVNACINNLRQIDGAANQFALEHKLTNGSPINFPNDLTPYIKLISAGRILGCPQGGVYNLSKIGGCPTCSLGTTVIPAHVLP